MVQMRRFDVLFLTNFSDACFRAIPALAQLGDDIDLRLTIVHAYGPDQSRDALEPTIRSFFPEADHYAACRRLLLQGTPLEAVKSVRRERPVDLIVAPAGDPLGMPRLGHTSLRARLIKESGAPVLTLGRGALGGRLVRPTRTVACCIDVAAEGHAHLRLAAEYARSLNAALHVIQVLPDVDEASIATLAYAERFDRHYVARLARQAGAFTEAAPELHATSRSGLARLLAKTEADVVFLDGSQWIERGWLTSRMSRLVDELPCPSICVDAARNDVQWHLARNPARVMRDAMLAEFAQSHVGDFAYAH